MKNHQIKSEAESQKIKKHAQPLQRGSPPKFSYCSLESAASAQTGSEDPSVALCRSPKNSLLQKKKQSEKNQNCVFSYGWRILALLWRRKCV